MKLFLLKFLRGKWIIFFYHLFCVINFGVSNSTSKNVFWKNIAYTKHYSKKSDTWSTYNSDYTRVYISVYFLWRVQNIKLTHSDRTAEPCNFHATHWLEIHLIFISMAEITKNVFCCIVIRFCQTIITVHSDISDTDLLRPA